MPETDQDNNPAGTGTGTGTGDHVGPIILKVKSQGGNEMLFRIKRTTRLKKLMNAYCHQKSIELDSVAFFFDGHRLRPEQTPNELGMMETDEIEAILLHFTRTADQLAPLPIILKVKSQDGNQVHFRIKRSTKLRKLMNVYCQLKNTELNSIAFLFNGRRLRPEQTSEELRMEDNDEIDAITLYHTRGLLGFVTSLLKLRII